jgi:hypothetical protein
VSEKLPKITVFNPVVLPDKRRVTMEMVVDNLPTVFSNIAFSMPDMLSTTPNEPPKPDPNAPSPYPNIVLSISNSQHREVASLLIVEHKEPRTALTLHLRAPDPNERYVARAEMTYQDEQIDLVEVPFTLTEATPE